MTTGRDGRDASRWAVSIARDVKLGNEVPCTHQEMRTGGRPDDRVHRDISFRCRRNQAIGSQGGVASILVVDRGIWREGRVQLERVVTAGQEEMVGTRVSHVKVRR